MPTIAAPGRLHRPLPSGCNRRPLAAPPRALLLLRKPRTHPAPLLCFVRPCIAPGLPRTLCSPRPCTNDPSHTSAAPSTPDDQLLGGASSQRWPAVPTAAFRTLLAVSALLITGLTAAARPASAAPHRHDEPATATTTTAHSSAPQLARMPSIRAASSACDVLVRSAIEDDDALAEQLRAAESRHLEGLYLQHTERELESLKRVMEAPGTQQDPSTTSRGRQGGAGGRGELLLQEEFSAEVSEPAITLFGDQSNLSSAWTMDQNVMEIPYEQFWMLVGQGRVVNVSFDGSDSGSLLALLHSAAPGGQRVLRVELVPDPLLLDHLAEHRVGIVAPSSEAARLHDVFMEQFIQYTIPFFLISAVFWWFHSSYLDVAPNAFKRQEFIRYKREMLYITSKLNFRSPAREVRIDKSAPDFIAWADINGIDSVKDEIEEIIEYLKNPGLMRLQGVARIGGVLMAGAPGTGKTLLAKSIAAESGVRMFTCSGTDFVDVYSGVGARRIRETFDNMRKSAPAILFVDEFDALGAARGAAASGDESASIINELLVQMDGFEDNSGVIVLGASNRPGAIDSALIRPGRFDRIIYMPLPDAAGRAKILQVHARDKQVDPNLNWAEVSRAMAGFTGADCMGLMQRAAGMASRQGRDRIEEEDLYAALENKAMETFSEMTGSPKPGQDAGVPDPLPDALRKALAVYEAGKVLMAYITPEFEEIARVSICPCNLITGYTLFLEDEGKTMESVVLRADLESHIVVNLAGHCAEKLVMGESGVTSMGSSDIFQANMIAREMIMSMGMGRRMGPMDLMYVTHAAEGSGSMLRTSDPRAPDPAYNYHATDMSTEQARVAQGEVLELLEAGEAKAYYGLSINWKPLQALAQALLDRGVLQGKEVAHILETNGVIHLSDPHFDGFGWDKLDGTLKYPLKPVREAGSRQAGDGDELAAAAPAPPMELKGIRAKTWFAGTPQDAPRNEDGSFVNGWHWGFPGGSLQR